MFKPGEIHKNTQGNSVFHLAAYHYFRDGEVVEKETYIFI